MLKSVKCIFCKEEAFINPNNTNWEYNIIGRGQKVKSTVAFHHRCYMRYLEEQRKLREEKK